MKKAILISGIFWAVFSGIAALILFLVGAVVNSPEVIQETVNQSQGTITLEQAQVAAAAAQALMIGWAVYFLLGLVFAIVLIVLRNNLRIGKGAGIALGIVGVVLGATLPGIFFIVDSAKNR